MAKRSDIETMALDPLPGAAEVLQLPASGPVVIPGGGLLSDAIYIELDGDLLVELGDGSRLVIDGYFDVPNPPPLATEAGTHVAADIVAAMAGRDPGMAQATATASGAPIGRVETAEGQVEIVHADGRRSDAEAGTLIARNDRIETGDDGAAGLLFADESTFSIGHHGKATFQDLVFDPDSNAAHATFSVQHGTFAFSGGGIADHDGAFLIKTPSATITVDGASGVGRVEGDGATSVTYLRAEDAEPGLIRVHNPGGSQVLDNSYETLTVEDFFQPPGSVFNLGPRDTVEHFGDAVSALPDAFTAMPQSLLATVRAGDPASKAAADALADEGLDPAGIAAGVAPGDTLADHLQVDRQTAFEIAARKAAIAAAARDAADQALGDAAAAERAAREQALRAEALAENKGEDVEQLRQQALGILEESEQRDRAFENAVRQAERAEAQETDAARAVAETDLAEAQAAERLAQAEEAVRRALEAADRARAEALAILDEAKQREQAFADAQRAAAEAKAEEDSSALAVAEADAAEEAAAAALRAADAAARAARAEADAAARVAQEAGTAAEVVESVVQRELAAIDPELLKPPAADDPASAKGEWITKVRASMDVASMSLTAGEDAAREAYRNALRRGSSIEDALARAVAAAEAYGGAASADRVIAAGPDGLIDGDEAANGPIEIAGGSGGGFGGDGSTTGVVGSDVLIGGAGADGLAAGGFGASGVDGLFGFGFSFTPITLSVRAKNSAERRDDAVALTATAVVADHSVIGSGLADFLVADTNANTMAGQEGNDFLYGETPVNYLAGTHNAGNALLNPTFAAAGSADLISGGAGDDMIWGGAGDDTLYGDLPADTSIFGLDLGSAGAGADTLWGGAGNDTLIGGGGADILEGEDGDDWFKLGDDDAADDTVRGGDAATDTGSDTVDYSGAGAAVTIDLGAGTATGTATGTDSVSGIEHAVGTDFDDTISGSAAANSLSGGDGNDTLFGLSGADNIFGYAGDDVIIGGEGTDTLSGGGGADTFRFEGGSGADALAHAASLGTDLINDYNASENDLFMLSDGDFGLGAAGTLTDGTNYFEADTTTIDAIAKDLSGGGVANAGIVIIGSANGGDGAEVWYTDDASNMSNANSYQIAEVSGADRSTIEAGDFQLKG